MMPFSQQDVLRVVEQYGPIIPNKIKQKLEAGDATMINVYLSNLREEGKIRFTKLQLGSSKFAYTKKQKPELETLIQHLNEKDRRTANLLKEKKILRKKEQEPLVRVGLEQIKDFAIPIKVHVNQEEEIFYRYFLVEPEDAQKLIRQQLQPQASTQKQEVTQNTAEHNQEPDKTTKEEPPAKEEASEPEEETEHTHETREIPKVETQKQLQEQEIEPTSQFSKTIINYCAQHEISIQEIEETRKNSEIELILKVPTAVGKILFYAKAKSKKKSNDGDLAAAVLAAKTRMLPAIYLTTGEVTNKAKENPELREITVIEIGR